MRVTRKALSGFYRAHGVRLRQAKKVYRYVRMNEAALEADRRAFAVTMGNLMAKGTPVIFADESTFQSNHVQSKSWSLRDHPNQHYIDPVQASVTVYGAVGEALTKSVWYLGRSTNQNDYTNFITIVAKHIKADVKHQKPLLLYDGHPVHTTAQSLRLVQRWFTPLQNVRYSSNFNSPIESYWGLAKRRLQKKLLMHHSPVTVAVLRQLVLAALTGISAEAHRGLLTAHRAYVRRYLELEAAQ